MSREPRPIPPAAQQAANDRLEGRIVHRLDESVHALQERMDSSFEVVFKAMGGLQSDLRRGQLDRQAIMNRTNELDLGIGELRDGVKKLADRIAAVESGGKEQTKEAVVEIAPVLAIEATRAAPHELWTSLSGMQKVFAIAAASVAMLAGLSGAMTGLERLASGIAEGAKAAWTHTRGEPVKPKG